MNWIYFGGYSIGALVSARCFYTVAFEIDYKDSDKRGIKDEAKKLHFASRYGIAFSWFGLVWPVAWVVLAVILFIRRPTSIEKDIEKARKEKEFNLKVEEEVARLRKYLESMDLEAPDNGTLRKMAEESLRND